MPKAVNVRVTTIDAELEFAIQPNTTENSCLIRWSRQLAFVKYGFLAFSTPTPKATRLG